MKILVVCVSLILLSSCQYFQADPPPRAVKDSLSQKYAELRKKNISDVRYDLKFDLTGKNQFRGTTEVRFNLKEAFYLTLDFSQGSIEKLLVNNKELKEFSYNNFFIEIPTNSLVKGANVIRVDYTHPYSKNGMGLYKYTDAIDGRTYIYSNFEPYKANRLFPCFDQPNLKANYVTEVRAPQSWQVISANRETVVEEFGETSLWKFPMTQKFSTYTYSLHGGEYQVWEDVAKLKKREVPLRLFARQSLAKYVDRDEWFGLTKSGLKFFEKYFSTQYPYSKYDQVIVPDFNTSAMENVGAVTFNEDRFVAKAEKNRNQKRFLALVLYHEMAHMWFGNLVTMDWWNDLWLNESFATYASYVGVVASTEFEEAWTAFNTYAKQSAYRADQSINTHPVAMEVESTAKAFSHFDGITYGKGASVLRQLSFYLGDKTYKKALKEYFKRFAHKNTTLMDFIAVMEEASKLDLQGWKERWLKTSMLNDVEVHFTCKKGKISNFEIYQTGTQEYPMLRTHKTKVALFRKWRGVYKLHKTKNIEYSGERTFVKAMVGKLCPDLVYPNYKDYDYTTVTLDKKSLRHIESSLVSVQDSFLRGILWTDLWQMVLNQKMDIGRYLEVVEFNGLAEDNADNLEKVLNNVNTVLGEYYPRETEEWEQKRMVWVKFFEQAYLNKIQENIEDIEKQKIWFSHLVSLAESPDIHKEFVRLLKKRRSKIQLNFPLDQDRRWDLLARIISFGAEGGDKLLQAEIKKDQSKRGALKALYVRSLNPNQLEKQKLLDEVVKSKDTKKLGYLRTLMSGLFPNNQKEIQKQFEDHYYKVLKTIHETADSLFVYSFTSDLAPNFCDESSSQKMEDFMEAEKNLSFGVVKRLKAALFENKRCYEMRKLFKGDKNKINP